MTNMLESLEDWTETLDRGDKLDIIYLDYSKAFDTVPHKRLLAKLYGYGIRGRLLDWLKSFLTGRKQQVSIGTAYSDWGEVTSGIPQGSVLGPILFVIYVNDMPLAVNSGIKMFADDTKLYRAISTDHDHEELQKDLANLESWAHEWLLSFNVSKCKVQGIVDLKRTDEITLWESKRKNCR